jgi:hypothetical protein
MDRKKKSGEETPFDFSIGPLPHRRFGQSEVRENRRIERVCFYVWLCPNILQVSQRALELKGKRFLVHSIHTGLVIRNKAQSYANGIEKMAQNEIILMCKIILLDFVYRLNYKIMQLQRFGSWILLPSSGKKWGRGQKAFWHHHQKPSDFD